MKRTFTRFYLMLLIIVTASACEKSEEVCPKNQPANELKKGTTQPTSSVVYTGRATAIDATIWSSQNGIVTSNQSLLAETYFIPAAGGTINAALPSSEIPGSLTSGALSASSSGQN